MSLYALLRAAWSRAIKLPPAVTIAALCVILAAGATFYAYRRGVAAGALAERLKSDRTSVQQTEGVRTRAAAAVVEQLRAVERSTPTVARAHAAAKIVDSNHVEISNASTSPTIVEVPGPIITRFVEDSAAIRQRDAAIAALLTQVRADTSVIRSKDVYIRDLERATAPRCSWKCGAVLGVVSTVTAAVVAHNVRIR